MATIRELKHRHKVLLAEGKAVPHTDLPIDLPLSTGSPLADAAVLEKVVDTAQMNDTEHLARIWHLLQTADSEETASLGPYNKGLLNDFKMALSLRAWQNKDETLLHETLASLPASWRLLFPTAVVKPAAVFLSGWRKDIDFRFVDPRFHDLRSTYATSSISAFARP